MLIPYDSEESREAFTSLIQFIYLYVYIIPASMGLVIGLILSYIILKPLKYRKRTKFLIGLIIVLVLIVSLPLYVISRVEVTGN